MKSAPLFHIIIAIACMLSVVTRAQNCPDWSPKFDQVQNPQAKQALDQNRRAGWDALIAQGGDIQQQIAAAEQALEQSRAELARASQCAAAISSKNSIPPTIQMCLNPGQGNALSACMCEQLNTHDEILTIEGTLDLLHCRAGVKVSGNRSVVEENTSIADESTSIQNDHSAIQSSQQGFEQFENSVAHRSVAGDNAHTANTADVPSDVAILASRGAAIEDQCSHYAKAQYIGCAMGVREFGSIGDSGASSGNGSAGTASSNSDDDLDMLARDGTLRPDFVNETSTARAVVEVNRSSCSANVQLKLIGASPSALGSVLHFVVNVDTTEHTGGDQNCVQVEYSVFATERHQSSASNGYSTATAQTFESKTTDTGPIDLQLDANGTNGIELVGWKVGNTKCHLASNCRKKLTPEQCAPLLDYQRNELPNRMLVLIKQYGIRAQGREEIEKIRAELGNDRDLQHAASDFEKYRLQLKLVVDGAQGLLDVISPRGKLQNLVVTMGGARPSLTSMDYYNWLTEKSDGLAAIKNAVDGNILGLMFDISKKYGGPIGHYLAAVKEFEDNTEKIEQQAELRATLDEQLSNLGNQLDGLNASMDSTKGHLDTLNAASLAIDMACGNNR